MGYLIGLGVIGLAISLIFFTRLKSLNPYLRASILGIRVLLIGSIFFIIVIFGGGYYVTSLKPGQNVFGGLREDLAKESIIGKWDIEYQNEEDILYRSEYHFYTNGIVYDRYGKVKGKWSLDIDNKILTMHMEHWSKSYSYNIEGFDGSQITTNGRSWFTKFSDTPENLDVLLKEDIKRPADELIGTWDLKKIEGSLDYHLGIYQFDGYGLGSHTSEDESKKENIPVKYKLELRKNLIRIMHPDKVILLNIKSFNDNVLIGYPNEEPETKYILSKGL